MREILKNIKRLLREQAALAYEEELRRELAKLAAAFDKWKEGKINSDTINDMIHEFHKGPHRDLYLKYNSKMYEPIIASAIVQGILEKEKVPNDLLKHLGRLIKEYEGDFRRE